MANFFENLNSSAQKLANWMQNWPNGYNGGLDLSTPYYNVAKQSINPVGDPLDAIPDFSNVAGGSALSSAQAVRDILGDDYKGAYYTGDIAQNIINAQNSTPTAKATGDDNQGYMEGLFTSQGELEKQEMAYNDARDKLFMEWYERMSNTAYQRAMADMKSAGLNPILAYMQGGASTPSVTPSNYSLGGGDTFTDFVNMITNGASNVLRAIASFLPSGQAQKLTEVAKEISYEKGKTSVKTVNTYS